MDECSIAIVLTTYEQSFTRTDAVIKYVAIVVLLNEKKINGICESIEEEYFFVLWFYEVFRLCAVVLGGIDNFVTISSMYKIPRYAGI